MVTEPDRDRFVSFLGTVCPYAMILSILFGILVVFILITLLSMYLLAPPHPSYYVALMATIVNGLLAVSIGIVLYYCRQFNLRMN